MDTAAVREKLRQVIDPELGVNIVDLGLVYDISFQGDELFIQMTLTTPGCPLHDSIVGAVRRSLADDIAPDQVHIELVWEPRWSPANMTPAAREQLAGF